MPKVNFQDIGLMPYKKTWAYQEKLFEKIIAAKRAKSDNKNLCVSELLFCEHPHVITLGKSGLMSNLIAKHQDLKTKKVEFVQSNRGGDITYHGPGQIVGYPIFDLDQFFTDIHKYMRFLEEVVIRTLADYNMKGERLKGATGVWLNTSSNPRKIAAMGVRSSRWVTMHGFAFNVNTDLSFYNLIIPCGIDDKPVTSLQAELNKEININEVKTKLKNHFANVFEFEYVKK